jgi:cobalt/nickel transport system permease protein
MGSPVHRLDPRVKMAVALLLIAGVMVTPERAAPVFLLIWLLIVGLALAGQLSVWGLARKGTIALPFALAAITLLITVPGAPLTRVFGLTITEPGAMRFASIMLKSWLAVQVSLILTLTTPFFDLLWALRSLGVPGTLIAVFSLTYRYLYTLKDEMERILRARAARSGSTPGQKSGGSLGWRASVAGGMAGNLFLRSYERSERVYAAMLSRGYQGEIRLMNPPALRRNDVLLGGLPILVILVIQIMARLFWS